MYMRRRRIFLLVFLILILILVVGLLWLWRTGRFSLPSIGQQAGDPTPTPAALATPVVETERVVVALQTIPRGMPVPPDAVEVREWPKDEGLPDDVASKLSDVVGKTARVDIPRQWPVSKSSVTTVELGAGADMALAIPKGKVAIAVPVRVLSAVANAIQPSDRVDVLVSLSMVGVDEDSQIKQPVVLVGGEDCLAGCQPTGEQIPRLVTQYTVQNAQVLAIGLWREELPPVEVVQPATDETPAGEETTPPPEPPNVLQSVTQLTVVTMAVSPQDAMVLKWALESNSSIDLVMRSAIDQDIYAQPEAVTLQYMLDRFQISVPPRLPHAPENNFEYRILKEAQESAPASGSGE
jgi:pilus assembly protein CpaB